MDIMKVLGPFLVVILLLVVLMVISHWKIFEKANQPGWAALIPFYNIYVLSQVIGRPQWWVILYLSAIIPILGIIALIVISIMDHIRLAKVFGKDTGFAVGLVLLPIVFLPMLAFGDSTYQGKPAQ